MYSKKSNVAVIVVFILCFFVGIAASVFAQESTSTQIQKETNLTRQTQTSVLTNQKQVRITNLIANISNRSDAQTTRLQSIAVRIETRIAKMEQNGLPVSNAQSAVQEAKAALVDAQTRLSSIDSSVYNIVTSEDPRSKWTDLKTNLITINTDITIAKQSLQTALTVLKNASSIRAQGTTTTPIQSE